MHEIEIECFDDRADFPVAELANVKVAAAEAHPRNKPLADCITPGRDKTGLASSLSPSVRTRHAPFFAWSWSDRGVQLKAAAPASTQTGHK
jgi:hypothetical protein